MKRSDGNGPRRTPVAKHPGVYYRDTPRGRVYEITYIDSDGKRRWPTIGTSLRDADAALVEIKSKLNRGERVAPTRITLAEYAPTWLDSQTQLRPRTRDWYSVAIRVHIVPRLGRLRLTEITTDDVARLIREMRDAGYSGWTMKGVLVPLSRMLGAAARRNMIPANPVARLERGERPQSDRREMRVLNRDEIARLLDATPPMYHALIATSVFTGLRQSEALGLTWADVDLDGASLHVRRQLGRDGRRAEPKTPQAKRTVVLMPSLLRLLREHKARAFGNGAARADDYVFASLAGGPLHYRNVVRRGLDKAVVTAGLDLDGKPKLRWHDLRHTAASLLISEGLNVAFVSRQLGHADPSITLKVYARLFDAAEHAQRASDALEASFGALVARLT